MKFLIENWILVFMAVTSGVMLLLPVLRGGGGGGNGVGTVEAVRLINREKGVLIDVGDATEFAAGHAAGARNVPLASLANIDSVKGLPSNKALPLLVMCPTGQRAGRAVAQLRKAGYEKAVAVVGGTAAWREANLPVEKSA